MKIRQYKQIDQQAIIELWGKCRLIKSNNNPKLDIARKIKVNPDLFLVAELNGKVIASVMGGYEGHRGWIHYLAVHPEHQRVGIGKKMMFEIEQCLIDKGCPKINLQIRAKNSDVIQFYQKIGFLNDNVISLGKKLIDDAPFEHEQTIFYE